MGKTTFIQDVIWWTNSPILFVCAILLYRKNLWREFPAFFLYLIFVGISSYVMIPVSRHWGFGSYAYFYGGLLQEGISIALSFFVLRELVGHVLTAGTIKIARSRVVAAMLLVLLLVGTISSLQATPEYLPPMKVIFVATDVLRAGQASLLVGLAILTLFFGFYWDDLAFGIALGFGLYAVTEILRTYLLAVMGPSRLHFTNLIGQWSYQIASLIWLFYVCKEGRFGERSDVL